MKESKKDLNYIAKVEVAIAEKYGEETIKNPRSGWTEEKEKEYLAQIKKIQNREDELSGKTEKVRYKGFLVAKKHIGKDYERTCPVCSVYSFESHDNVYMSKYNCCQLCYFKYVEHREKYWDAAAGVSNYRTRPWQRTRRTWRRLRRTWHRLKNILVKTSIRQLIISEIRKLIKWLNPIH